VQFGSKITAKDTPAAAIAYAHFFHKLWKSPRVGIWFHAKGANVLAITRKEQKGIFFFCGLCAQNQHWPLRPLRFKK
jgi:hypothetical protein